MIYIVWELGDELQPELFAFTNLRDCNAKLAECKQKVKQCDEDGACYRYGYWKIPNGKTKKELCYNINWKKIIR